MPVHESHPISAADLSTTAIRHDLHILLALVIADRELMHLAQPSVDGEPIFVDHMTKKHLLIDSLLRTAVVFRYLDDYKERGKKTGIFSNQRCGNLQTYKNRAEIITPLLPRKACNIIIHSNKFHFQAQEHKPAQQSGYLPLSPIIVISSDVKKQDSWQGNLDIIKFTQACYRALEIFESRHTTSPKPN